MSGAFVTSPKEARERLKDVREEIKFFEKTLADWRDVRREKKAWEKRKAEAPQDDLSTKSMNQLRDMILAMPSVKYRNRNWVSGRTNNRLPKGLGTREARENYIRENDWNYRREQRFRYTDREIEEGIRHNEGRLKEIKFWENNYLDIIEGDEFDRRQRRLENINPKLANVDFVVLLQRAINEYNEKTSGRQLSRGNIDVLQREAEALKQHIIENKDRDLLGDDARIAIGDIKGGLRLALDRDEAYEIGEALYELIIRDMQDRGLVKRKTVSGSKGNIKGMLLAQPAKKNKVDVVALLMDEYVATGMDNIEIANEIREQVGKKKLDVMTSTVELADAFHDPSASLEEIAQKADKVERALKQSPRRRKTHRSPKRRKSTRRRSTQPTESKQSLGRCRVKRCRCKAKSANRRCKKCISARHEGRRYCWLHSSAHPKGKLCPKDRRV